MFKPIRKFQESFHDTEEKYGPSGRFVQRKRTVEYTATIVQVTLRSMGISSVCSIEKVLEASTKLGFQNFDKIHINDTWFSMRILRSPKIFFPKKGGKVYFERPSFSSNNGSIRCISAKIEKRFRNKPHSPKEFESYTPEVPNTFSVQSVMESQRFIPQDYWLFVLGDVQVTYGEWENQPIPVLPRGGLFRGVIG